MSNELLKVTAEIEELNNEMGPWIPIALGVLFGGALVLGIMLLDLLN